MRSVAAVGVWCVSIHTCHFPHGTRCVMFVSAVIPPGHYTTDTNTLRCSDGHSRPNWKQRPAAAPATNCHCRCLLLLFLLVVTPPGHYTTDTNTLRSCNGHFWPSTCFGNGARSKLTVSLLCCSCAVTPPGHYTTDANTLRCPDGQFRPDWKPAAEAGSCTPCGEGVQAARSDAVVAYNLVTYAEEQVAVTISNTDCCKSLLTGSCTMCHSACTLFVNSLHAYHAGAAGLVHATCSSLEWLLQGCTLITGVTSPCAALLSSPFGPAAGAAVFMFLM